MMRQELSALFCEDHIRSFHVEQVDSTNDLAYSLISQDQREGEEGNDLLEFLEDSPKNTIMILADRQSRGKGRNGHTWLSDEDGSLTVSYIVSVPSSLLQDQAMNWLTPLAGVATVQVLEEFVADKQENQKDCKGEAFDRLQLKWPNDIMLRGGKLGGILSQLVPARGGRGPLIIGIGLNLSMPDKLLEDLFELGALATRPACLDWLMEIPQGSDLPAFRQTLALAIGRSLSAWMGVFNAHPHGTSRSLHAHLERMNFLADRYVTVTFPTGISLAGKVKGIEPDACLTVEFSDGRTRRISVGDVTAIRTGWSALPGTSSAPGPDGGLTASAAGNNLFNHSTKSDSDPGRTGEQGKESR